MVGPKHLLIRGYHLRGPCLWNTHLAPVLWSPAGPKSNLKLIHIILQELNRTWQNTKFSFLSICLLSKSHFPDVLPAFFSPASHVSFVTFDNEVFTHTEDGWCLQQLLSHSQPFITAWTILILCGTWSLSLHDFPTFEALLNICFPNWIFGKMSFCSSPWISVLTWVWPNSALALLCQVPLHMHIHTHTHVRVITVQDQLDFTPPSLSAIILLLSHGWGR